MQTLETLLLIAFGVVFTVIGDVFLKKSNVTNYWFLAFGLILYAIGVIPVAIVFKRIEFGSVFLIWEAVTVILAMLVASLYFKEPFTIYKGIALFFALCALYFSYK